jgi:glucose-6-phosphate isomerase
MFAGEHINATEDRAALHVALRALPDAPFKVDGASVMPAIHDVLRRMREFAGRVRSGVWTGSTGQGITDIVNIGIGGSDLGPRMVCRALAHLADPRGPRVHFVSNVDGTELAETLQRLDPARTLAIVCSKTFTTLETMANACSMRDWFLRHGVAENQLARHFVAVSTNRDAVVEFGIDPNNMFEFWDWIGGRFSLWSSVGLSIALAVGFDAFEDLLLGGRAMDDHFRTAPLARNMPVVMAMLASGIAISSACRRAAWRPIRRRSNCFRRSCSNWRWRATASRCSSMASGARGYRASGLGHGWHQRPARLFPDDPPGLADRAGRFRRAAGAAARTAGHHVKLLANCFAQAEADARAQRGRTARPASPTKHAFRIWCSKATAPATRC